MERFIEINGSSPLTRIKGFDNFRYSEKYYRFDGMQVDSEKTPFGSEF